MQIFQGIAVSPGVVVGEALVVEPGGHRIAQRFVMAGDIPRQLERLEQALQATADELAAQQTSVSARLGKSYGAIFAAHLALLSDTRLCEELRGAIQDKKNSAEFAVRSTMRRFADQLAKLENSIFAERASDLLDLENRLLQKLLGRSRDDLGDFAGPVILLVHQLTPSQAARLDQKFVLGLATEAGGAGGHTAIVAEALEIPTIVGAGNFLASVSSGDTVILDAEQGRVIVNPDEDAITHYRRQLEAQKSHSAKLGSLKDLRAETADGVRIHLAANIEFPREVETCLSRGADGIGLYRTEFLYLASDKEPTEEDHFQAYSQVAKAMGGRPVVIRTLDLGADKLGQAPAPEDELNPFLGLRSIRLSLRNLQQFRTQLRAILRASVAGNVQIMFPLISTIYELRQAKMVLADVVEDLEEEGLPFRRDVAIGMMVEVPSAVVMLDRFAAESDFFSIGTNDLIQYALAVDRTNKEVSSLYSGSDPAVLRLIEMTIRAAAKNEVPVSLCGQMSGSISYTMLLLGLGLRSLSVAPSALAEVKRMVRSVKISECEEIARRAMSLDLARDVDHLLREESRRKMAQLATG